MTSSSDPTHVGVHEAKTHLSRLLERVLAGEEIVIDRRGEPVARLTAIDHQRPPVLGSDRGSIVVHEDFDAPLPEEIARALGS